MIGWRGALGACERRLPGVLRQLLPAEYVILVVAGLGGAALGLGRKQHAMNSRVGCEQSIETKLVPGYKVFALLNIVSRSI